MTSIKHEFSNRIEWRNEEGHLHRVDGPAIEWDDKNREWWANGDRHRVDGPAVESCNGNKWWFQFGKLHRLDGPAIEYENGDNTFGYKGVVYKTKELWFEALTDEDKISYLFNMK